MQLKPSNATIDTSAKKTRVVKIKVRKQIAMLGGAIIDYRFFATNHLHGWRDVKGAEIVAICAMNEERLNLVGDQFGIERRYVDPVQLFANKKLDFVDIATTAPSHRALVELSAKHGVATICQKPLASMLGDAQAIVQACAKAQAPVMVHENCAHMKQLNWCAMLLKREQIL